MGWESFYCDKPSMPKELKALVEEKFNTLGFRNKTRILKQKLVGKTWYAKVESTDHDGNKYAWFCVCVTDWKDGELYLKWLDNSCGPGYYDCPVDWFKGVPVHNEYDAAWRKSCEVHQTKKTSTAAAIKLLKAGDLVKFSTRYGDSDKWYYTGEKWTFSDTPGGRPCKLRNWRKYFVGVVAPADTTENQSIEE